MSDLEGYVAECERKIEQLEGRLTKLEARVEATIKVATREVRASLITQLHEALEEAFPDA